MKLTNTRFSDIDYEEDDVITFPSGLIGFGDQRRYLLISTREGSPFRWLQNLEIPQLAFLVVDPDTYVQDYRPPISDRDAKDLQLSEETPLMIYSTVAIPPGRPHDMTLNLAAPIMVNASLRIGAQVVLEDAAYTMKHRVFDQTNQTSEEAAA